MSCLCTMQYSLQEMKCLHFCIERSLSREMVYLNYAIVKYKEKLINNMF